MHRLVTEIQEAALTAQDPSIELNDAGNFTRIAGRLVAGAKLDPGGLSIDVPETRFDDGNSFVHSTEFTHSRSDTFVALPKPFLAGAGPIPKRFRKAVAVKWLGIGLNAFGATEQRPGDMVVDLPNETTATKSRSEPRDIGDGVEQINAQGVVGEGKHGSPI
jgi:hypothetical protein